MAELVHEPIDTAALLARASRPDCGAVVLFMGTTRDHHEGRRVVRLAYECYERMALPALERLEREARERHAIEGCVVIHRLGEVPPSEASVAVVVTAHHRGAAFEACRWLMDELKRSVPIWKKERFADGGDAWVEGHPLSRS